MKIKKTKLDLYLTPIIGIILGALIIIFKGEVIRWAALAVGIAVVAISVINIINDLKKDNNHAVVIDVAMILIGALIIVFAGAFATAIRIVIGVFLICFGILRLLSILDALPREIKIVLIIESILYILSGTLLFLDKSVLYYIIGGLLVFNGIVDILYSRAEAKLINGENNTNNHEDAIDVDVKEK